MSIHTTYGGSTMHRTLACPAWVQLSKDIPAQPTSDAAMTGTALHNVLEWCIEDVDLDPITFIGSGVEGVEITDEHIINKIDPALKAIDNLIDTYDLVDWETEIYCVSEVHEDISGSTDFFGWGDEYVVVADYKSGDGVMVYAADNAQLMFYACLLMADPRFRSAFQNRRIILAIIQPSDRRDDVLDYVELTRQDLTTFWNRVLDAVSDAVAIHTSDPAPGAHCRYCPAEAVCPAKTGVMQSSRRLPVDSPTLMQLTEAMAIVSEVEDWTKAVRKLAHEQLEQGVAIDGFKLVNKRATRVYTDLDNITAKVTKMRLIKNSDAFETKLKSPAQLEKVCKSLDLDFKKLFGDYVSAVSSGTTIATASDPRAEAVTLAKLQNVAIR